MAAVLQPTVHPSYSKIYLTATLTNPEVHGPLCASCTAARTCTACPTWTIAGNCTEPMQRHCKLHVGARHCTAVSCSITGGRESHPLYISECITGGLAGRPPV